MKGPMKIKTSVLFKEIAVDSKLHVLIGNEGPPFSWPISLNRACQQLIREKKNWKSIHKHQRNEPSKFRSSETSEASETNKTRFLRRAKRAFKSAPPPTNSPCPKLSNNCQATIAIIFPSSFIIFKVGPDTVAPVVSGKQGRQVKKAVGKRQQFQLFSLA